MIVFVLLCWFASVVVGLLLLTQFVCVVFAVLLLDYVFDYCVAAVFGVDWFRVCGCLFWSLDFIVV